MTSLRIDTTEFTPIFFKEVKKGEEFYDRDSTTWVFHLADNEINFGVISESMSTDDGRCSLSLDGRTIPCKIFSFSRNPHRPGLQLVIYYKSPKHKPKPKPKPKHKPKTKNSILSPYKITHHDTH